ncbi:hypothetical protein A8A12_01745 [Serratia marcescens]|nr:hypothetical protein A8A12_01745 [Serratia marcescens]
MNEVLTYEALKAERDAQQKRADALAVENQALKSAITGKAYIDFVTSNGWNPGMKTINGKFAGFMDAEIDFGCMAYDHAKKLIDAVETPATSAALASIQARILPPNIAEIIDSGDLETICYGHEHPFAERIRLAMYNFRQLREAK